MASQLRGVQRASLAEQVYQTLRRAILHNELESGVRLVQDDLAARLGTSRIPVRDALLRLESEGLVEADVRGTYRVTSFGVEDAAEVYALRALLEPYAARQALARLSPGLLEQLAALNQQLEQAAASGEIERYVTLNYDFHMLLYEASGQRRLLRMIQRLWSGLPPLTPLSVRGQLERSLAEHSALLKALRRGEAAAVEQLLRAHIENAGAALVAQLQPRQPRE